MVAVIGDGGGSRSIDDEVGGVGGWWAISPDLGYKQTTVRPAGMMIQQSASRGCWSSLEMHK